MPLPQPPRQFSFFNGRTLAILSALSFGGGFIALKMRQIQAKRNRDQKSYHVDVNRSGGGI